MFLFFRQLGGIVAASSLAEVSSEALKVMLLQELGTGGVLDVWLTLARHKVRILTAITSSRYTFATLAILVCR